MTKVEEAYRMWFKIWKDTWVRKLMKAPKWFKSDQNLEEDDLVYFQKTPSPFDTKSKSKWTIGQVEQVNKGPDGKVRSAVIKYKNSNEKHFQFTDRAVRSLVKIFSLGDASINEDLAEVQKFVKTLDEKQKEIKVSANGAELVKVKEQREENEPVLQEKECEAVADADGAELDNVVFFYWWERDYDDFKEKNEPIKEMASSDSLMANITCTAGFL